MDRARRFVDAAGAGAHTELNLGRMTMNWKRLIPWAVVALAAFLFGYVPQRMEVGRMRGEIAASLAATKGLDERVNRLQFEIRLGELRDLAGIMHLETGRRNFGIAQQHSTRFFTSAGKLAREVSDSELKAILESIVAERDRVTASLAKGDVSSHEATLKLFERIHENLGRI
jgi:hypothetical protein